MGNFDFEHRRVHGGGALSRVVQSRKAALAASWRLIAGEGDALWRPFEEPPRSRDHAEWEELPRLRHVANPRALAEGHEIVFWANDDWAFERSAAWGFDWGGPRPDVVARVNSRRFQVEWERRLGLAPGGLAIAEGRDGLLAAVAELGGEAWILKTEFGTAGRESVSGKGAPSEGILAWAEKRFARGLAIVVEPRLHRIAEASFQFQLHAAGEVEFLEVVGSLTHPDGTFLASRLLSEAKAREWSEGLPAARSVAEAIAAEGYHGPLGIDAMRFRDRAGQVRFRPVQDINARYTFGRLALGLRRFPGLMRRSEGTLRPLRYF